MRLAPRAAATPSTGPSPCRRAPRGPAFVLLLVALLAPGLRAAEPPAPRNAEPRAVDEGRSVEGSVHDDLGMVVPGARVRVRALRGGRPSGAEWSTRSGSDGSFRLTGLPTDELFAWDASSPGHEETRGELGGETRLEVVLVRAQRVTGRLVDGDGLPVPGLPVEVSYVTEVVETGADGGERRQTSVEGHAGRVVSGEDGRFSFFRNLPASLQVAPQAEGRLPSTRVLEALGDGAERGELDLGDLVLRPGRTIAGRVLVADGGAPVEGARLEAVWARDDRSPGREWGVSERDGSFRVEGVLPGREVTLTARKEGFAPRTLTVDPEADSVDLLLGRGGRVKGRACGTPWELPNVVVWYASGGAAANREQVAVDRSGRFALANVEPGPTAFRRSWRIRDSARAGSAFEWSGAVLAVVEVREGETAQVSLGCEGIPLSGVVTRAGRPAATEIVTFSLGGAAPVDALTDGAGGFSTLVPGPGTWLLSAGGSALSPAAACEVPPGGLEGCRVEIVPTAR